MVKAFFFMCPGDSVEDAFSHVAEGGVSQVVAESDGFGEILIQAKAS